MQSRAIYSFFGVLLLVGLSFAIYFSIQPKPIPKIKISSFETPIKLALAVQLRMREEIQKAQILIFGYQPEKSNQLNVIQEFIQSNKEKGYAYDTLVVDESLSDLQGFESAEKVKTKDNTEVLAEGLKTAIQQNRRVLVIIPSIYSAQMVHGSVADLLKKKYKVPITSFSLVELPRSREEEKSVVIPCYVTDADPTGAGQLGCSILQQARALYRKKMESGKRVGLMDQRGATDYLIFYSNEVEK